MLLLLLEPVVLLLLEPVVLLLQVLLSYAVLHPNGSTMSELRQVALTVLGALLVHSGVQLGVVHGY